MIIFCVCLTLKSYENWTFSIDTHLGSDIIHNIDQRLKGCGKQLRLIVIVYVIFKYLWKHNETEKGLLLILCRQKG